MQMFTSTDNHKYRKCVWAKKSIVFKIMGLKILTINLRFFPNNIYVSIYKMSILWSSEVHKDILEQVKVAVLQEDYDYML